ncbi:glycerol-3-phosphate acyltransferase [Kallotenue papyrolyticum]|uniref:glycerol-3-phosphate acyltransferase n=1 Tax=Kallotenue papyrolyticum TaxID=1325125 RepID=UPI000478619A|nr:glycerol-3-phosphate acyltransferase [Kallotenue papyrolyticum]
MPLVPILLTVSYLLGAIPFAVIVVRRLRGVHIQQVGSGNAGALNSLRTAGLAAGVSVALLDALKAALAMLLGRLALGPEAAALCGAATVAGHCFSPYLIVGMRRARGGGWKHWLRRSGGKGLASGMAVLLLLDWRLAGLTLLIFGAAFALLRRDETWPTIIAVSLTPLLVWWLTASRSLTFATLIVGIVIIIKHLPDVREGFWVGGPAPGNEEPSRTP